ncbi:MAG: hypothetical protein WC489_04370 [Patescibacteria group bacterium]
MKKRQVQIGVVGSMMDIKQTKKCIDTARDIGKEIAKHNCLLLFGFEGDSISLSEVCARSHMVCGGRAIAFIHGSAKTDFAEKDMVQIITGQSRAGGREFSFILSCDVIIVISGGSGTLMEVAMAYQAAIPIVLCKGTGGWADKLKDRFLDKRKRVKVLSVLKPSDIVKKAISLVKK